MTKTEKIISICACSALLVVALLAVANQSRNRKSDSANRKAVSSIAVNAGKADSTRTSETSRIASEDFYQKLREGRDIRILVIGDDIGSSAGATSQNGWTDVLVNKLHAAYQSNFSVVRLPQTTTNVVKGWIGYTQGKDTGTITPDGYDAVFLCVGYYDQTQIELKEFHMFYEQLLVQLIKDNSKAAIFPILESSFKSENGYSVDIRDLASYYGFNLIDAKDAFSKSGKDVKQLSADGVHPNDAGYSLYADAIYNTIVQNVHSNQSVTYSKKSYFYNDTGAMQNYKLITQGNGSGFQQQNTSYISTKKGDALTFSGSGSLIYVYYNTSPTGGSFQIFVDKQYAGEINTKSTGSDSTAFMLTNKISNGVHTIQIVNKQGNVSVIGVIAEQEP